jgi:hypothetical protein
MERGVFACSELPKLSQINPVIILTHYAFKTNFNTLLLSTPR